MLNQLTFKSFQFVLKRESCKRDLNMHIHDAQRLANKSHQKLASSLADDSEDMEIKKQHCSYFRVELVNPSIIIQNAIQMVFDLI